MQQSFTILCLGDVVGRPGRNAVRSMLPGLRDELNIDFIIANGENSAGGLGLDPSSAQELFESGVDVITLGDHTWSKRELKKAFRKGLPHVVRPANFPAGAPGRGVDIFDHASGITIGIMNLHGRVFFESALDCPFQVAEKILQEECSDCDLIICDFHGEATSEKIAFGRYFDGRIHCIFGTHTHVQTADEQVLPKGTAYISDLGMCGPAHGVIGMDAETAIARFRTGIKRSYKVASGDRMVNGLVLRYNFQEKFWEHVERIRKIETV